jgi:hypothetical protein
MANLGPCGLQTLARFSHCRLPFPGFEVVLPSDENSGLGVQLQKLRSPLVHQMIRHDERRFLRRVQPAKLFSYRAIELIAASVSWAKLCCVIPRLSRRALTAMPIAPRGFLLFRGLIQHCSDDY